MMKHLFVPQVKILLLNLKIKRTMEEIFSTLIITIQMVRKNQFLTLTTSLREVRVFTVNHQIEVHLGKDK